MNEAATKQYKEIVYRRLTEPIDFFGRELPAELWWVILAVVLGIGFFYIGWMYFKDSRGVGPWVASLLGLLRASVYVLLAWVFLLRAEQTWEESEIYSRAAVVMDVSGSLFSVDDIPKGIPNEKLDTRQEKVLEFLTSKKFFQKLEENNPVWVYRFAKRLDENYLLFRDGKNYTRAEWEDPSRVTQTAAAPAPDEPPPEPQPLARELWRAYLNMPLPATEKDAIDKLSSADKARYEKMLALNKKLSESGFFQGTNVGDSVLAGVNRESSNRMQGIIVITDGRSTEGSPEKFREIEKRAKDAHIPIFVIGVGDERPQVRIDVADIRVPDQVQPEDHFRTVVEVTGEGLADQKVDVELLIKHVRKGTDGKDVDLDIFLAEASDKDNAAKKGAVISLGKQLILKPTTEVKFDNGSPPRATVEFPIDARSLAAAAGKDLSAPEYSGKKWELDETKEGELRFTARVPRNKFEVFTGSHHTSDPAPLRVIKKPLRVLLFASAPMRDYQFLRTLLVREMDKKRAEMAIYLQPAPGRVDLPPGVVQDVEPERLLKEFPRKLEPTSNSKEELLGSLNEYDVIVAFDPDWTKLEDKQLKMIETWVNNGGGLIAIGGPINTIQLARPGAYREKLKPMLDLYPVVLRDVRIDELDRTTTDPWPLNFEGANQELEFLKLEESETDAPKKFLEDWDAFFYGPRKEGEARGNVLRGFFNYYPAESAKIGSLIVGRFTDPKAKLKDGTQQPFIVLSDPASHRRVVWIGSGETWRLRQYREAYHERFWTKLLRYAGDGRRGRVHKRIRLEMAPTYIQNKFVDVEAKIDAADGTPLGTGAKPPVVKVKLLGDTSPQKELANDIPMKAKPTGEGWFSTRFQVRSAGNYTLTLNVPDTGDTQSRSFIVREANPEMDNTRPDFEQMYQLASEADEVLGRLGDAEQATLKEQLRKGAPAGATKGPAAAAKPRLYFTLANADLIPKCMRKDVATQRSRGPIKDQWDEGVEIYHRDPPLQPIKMSYVLMAVVGLLSIEWLIRKLLRLA
jgi:hypothetical protein